MQEDYENFPMSWQLVFLQNNMSKLIVFIQMH